MKKNQYQIKVTQDSTPTIENIIQQDILSVPKRIKMARKSKVRFAMDPLENECPLEQPNPFIFNEQLQHSFRDYLEGQKTALNLVNECNHVIGQTHKMDQFKLFSNVNRFRTQLKQRSSIRMFMQQQNQYADDVVLRKIKVQERYNKIRQLIQQKMKSTNKNDSLKDVQMFKHLFDTYEKNVNKIKSKNLLSEKADGIREYDQIKYQKNPTGSLRVRVDTDKQQIPLQRRVKTLPQQSTLHQTMKKQREKMNTKLTEFLEHDQNQERNLQIKARRNLIRDLKKGEERFHSFEPNQYNLTDPLSKDVKLYAYMFMKQTKDDPIKKQQNHLNILSRSERTQNHQNRHYLANFKDQLSNSRDQSLDEDSSYNSMLEINIDNLYKRSADLQSKILNTKSEKLLKRIRQFQKVKQLTAQIIKVNELKLSNIKLL
ncbi:unnamed protein product [Paramecium sonneborni]|uniref:Uncharacterized protein n=1 Tax=Paramecium sonneborni TaxID=65129 RepID=A0A8S1R6K8_9CILI|nr:unnamed protein product [Paramecium sonneborni]